MTTNEQLAAEVIGIEWGEEIPREMHVSAAQSLAEAGLLAEEAEYPNAPLVCVDWDRDEVPEGYVDLTFRVPETGRGFHGLMTVDIIIKDN